MIDMKCFDFETDLIGPQNLAPTPICMSVAWRDEEGAIASYLISDGDDRWEQTVKNLFIHALRDGTTLVAQNTKYDAWVAGLNWPELIPVICDLFEQGLIIDTVICKKLICLTTEGWIDKGFSNSGKALRRAFALSDFALEYLHLDMEEVKKGEDAWRLRYSELKGVPSSRYPPEASSYAIDDSIILLKIIEMMIAERNNIIASQGFDPWKTLDFRCAVDFYLYRLSIEGIALDHAEIRRIEEETKAELVLERIPLLSQPRITDLDGKMQSAVKAAIEPREYSDGRQEHPEECPNHKLHPDFQKVKKKRPICGCKKLLTNYVKEGVNKKYVQMHVYNLFCDKVLPVIHWSDKAKLLELDQKFDQLTFPDQCTLLRENTKFIAVNADFTEEYHHLDPLLEQYQHRQSLQKILTTEIPRMMLDRENDILAEIVHGNFDCLKMTGRTSGFASKLYPSSNLQNIFNKVRSAFKARKGYWMLSTDYTALEFVACAQISLNTFGQSEYARVINNGWDSHGYLACQLALSFDKDFKEECYAKDIVGDNDAIYHAFMRYKTSKRVVMIKGQEKDFWKHYRTFAKPCGLGYAGGMGPATNCVVARGPVYQLDVTEDDMVVARNIWRSIFPWAAKLMKHMTKTMKDFDSSTKKFPKYVYTSPMGMRRPNCTFTAGANGNALQSPGAEGALMGMILVVREAYDPSRNSILFGNYRPYIFLHDEMIGDVLCADLDVANAVAKRQEVLMCAGLNVPCADVKTKAESAFMESWSKAAVDVYDEQGRLTLWKPTVK